MPDYIDVTFVAQLLMYGYDGEKEVFYIPTPTGGWHEATVSWEKFIKAFRVRQAYTAEQKGVIIAICRNMF